MKRILIIPPCPWYMEAHFEYLIRYLSDEFFIELAFVPYPPYEDFLNRYPVTSPFERNPDDYDLIVPILATHWGVVDKEAYGHKTAVIMYEPGEGKWHLAKAIAGATPIADSGDYHVKCHSVRFGIDTELFKPYPMVREDDLLHLGMVGSLVNPRRRVKDVALQLLDIPGVRLMFFPSNWENGGDVETLGGKEYMKRVVAGRKTWPGLPNIYNRLDVVLRIDTDYGYSFPTLEAAACGVPVIATDQGIDHLITEAGGGILLKPKTGGRYSKHDGGALTRAVRKSLIWMRDNPEERKQMGLKGRREIENNWTWGKHINNWRTFFREATS